LVFVLPLLADQVWKHFHKTKVRIRAPESVI